MNESFRKFAHAVANWSGSPAVFAISVLGILIWAMLGPLFQFSDTWQLVVNTATTVITFLMVFLIQNTQNRDARAIHLKLDELIRANATARNRLIDLEDLSDQELDILHNEFFKIQKQTEANIQRLRAHREKKKKSKAQKEEIIYAPSNDHQRK